MQCSEIAQHRHPNRDDRASGRADPTARLPAYSRYGTVKKYVSAIRSKTRLRALADGSRRNIVWRVAAEGELKVTDVARPFDMSLNAVSKHIKVLEQAGLVRWRVRGRDHWLSLRSEPLAAAHAWIGLYQRFWASRIDALERYLGDRQPDVH